MFVYPQKRMSPNLEKDGPPGALYKCSNNGWSNEQLFMDWIQHFHGHVKSSPEEPALLILDNHYSHVTLESYEYSKLHGTFPTAYNPSTLRSLGYLRLTIGNVIHL
ncbi:hypothetical protein ANN_26033 [Periplaneta americana]|uniref:DDE-1 domain-containing protein n=1 Tax=Periplaneta americana TaxID=6978 RepID=A0ABQ8S565_PERAM|nr:hypothetical protein ANN_26033 [Periplaneta americana]